MSVRAHFHNNFGCPSSLGLQCNSESGLYCNWWLLHRAEGSALSGKPWGTSGLGRAEPTNHTASERKTGSPNFWVDWKGRIMVAFAFLLCFLKFNCKMFHAVLNQGIDISFVFPGIENAMVRISAMCILYLLHCQLRLNKNGRGSKRKGCWGML